MKNPIIRIADNTNLAEVREANPKARIIVEGDGKTHQRVLHMPGEKPRKIGFLAAGTKRELTVMSEALPAEPEPQPVDDDIVMAEEDVEPTAEPDADVDEEPEEEETQEEYATRLASMLKSDLVEMADDRQLDSNGTKAEIAARIAEYDYSDE